MWECEGDGCDLIPFFVFQWLTGGSLLIIFHCKSSCLSLSLLLTSFSSAATMTYSTPGAHAYAFASAAPHAYSLE